MEYTEDLCVTPANGIESGHYATYDVTHVFEDTAGSYPAETWESNLSVWNNFIGYDFGAAKKIVKYTITVPIEYSEQFTPKEWNFQGSNDGISWSTLQSITNEPIWTPNEKREYIFSNEIEYTQYRLLFGQNVSVAGNLDSILIDELEMMGEFVVPVLASILYHTKKTKMRGKAAEGFIRPTIAEFFTSIDYNEISSLPTTIGQSYKGGYYMGTLGGYYLICAPITGQSQKVWGPYIIVPGADSLTDGYQNTLDMIADSEDHPAANFCVALTIGGFSDWYLPAKDELNLMYTNYLVLETAGAGSFIDHYWSSSEINYSGAWRHNFPIGYQLGDGKLTNYYVRAIRRVAI